VLQQACDDGNADSCHLLGLQYRSGRGVKRDPKRAAALLDKACDAGHAGSCTSLGRPVPYVATVAGAAPGGLSLSRFKSVYVGPIAGEEGERIREALKLSLKEVDRCFVTVTDDLDLVSEGDLAITGRVLLRELVHKRKEMSRVKELALPGISPEEAEKPGKKKTLAASRPATKRGSPPASRPATKRGSPPASQPAPVPAPGPRPVLRPPEAPRCARVTVTAKLWLFDGAEPEKPQEILVRGQASDEKCPRALRAAVSKLVGELVARLDLRFSRRVVLFKDSSLPTLEHGNAHAERGRWEEALEQYLHAVEAAKPRPEAKESLAHAIYSASVALANLGRYEEALASLRQALKTRLDPRYVPLIEHYRLVKGEAWAKPPPARPRRAKTIKVRKSRGKRRKVIHGMKRRVIWK
jgi:hypothetical protein